MDAKRLVLICLISWGIAVVLSFVHPYFTAPTGDGFVRGMNLIGLWLGWQVGALMFAVAALIVRFTRAADLSPPMRILAVSPACASMFAIVGLGSMLAFAG